MLDPHGEGFESPESFTFSSALLVDYKYCDGQQYIVGEPQLPTMVTATMPAALKLTTPHGAFQELTDCVAAGFHMALSRCLGMLDALRNMVHSPLVIEG
jgi:hypothetical protein